MASSATPGKPRRPWLRGLVVVLLVAGWASCTAGGPVGVPPPPVHPSFKTEIPAPEPSGRLPSWVQPLRYEVRLDIDPEKDSFYGEVFIHLRLQRATSAFVMHGVGLSVARAEVVANSRRIRAEGTVRTGQEAKLAPEEFVLLANDPIPAGEAVLHLDYIAKLTEGTRGIFKVRDEQTQYVFTQFEPSDARRMMPCFDDPVFKTPFEVKVTAPQGYKVFSNSPVAEVVAVEGGKQSFTFAPTPPLPTYLLALAIGRFDVQDGPTKPTRLRVIAAPGKAALGHFALDSAAGLLTKLSDYLDHPYPYQKLDLVAVPNFRPGAMENPGLMAFREELLLVDPKRDSARVRRHVISVMAHELAHQYFGNLVTMKWWDDLWLNEGFATYFETLIVDRYAPALRAGDQLLSQTGRIMDADGLGLARAVRKPVANTDQAEEAFDGMTYVKGASVVHMLHSWLGEDAFKKGIRAYLKAHAHGSAAADDIYKALAGSSGKDVALVASAFLDRPGVPLVSVRLRCNPATPATILLSQKAYRLGAAPRTAAPGRWPIPVCVEYGSLWQTGSTRGCTLLRETEGSIKLKGRCPDWFNPNADYSGYYRYVASPKALRALWERSKTGEGRQLIGFLSNAWALVQTGDLGSDQLLDMVESLRSESRLAVVEEILALLQRVSDALVQDPFRPHFERYVRAVLLPLAKRLGWNARPGDNEDARLLRREVLKALALLAPDPWMLTEARKRAQSAVEDFAGADPDTVDVALLLAAHRGLIERQQILTALQRARTPAHRVALVQALGSFSDETSLRQSLELLLSDKLRLQDGRYVVRATDHWPQSRAIFVRWLQKRLPEVVEKYGAGRGAARMIARVGRLCDPQQRAAAESAFAPILKRLGRGRRRLDEALEQSQRCIDLRNKQARVTGAYLRRQHPF